MNTGVLFELSLVILVTIFGCFNSKRDSKYVMFSKEYTTVLRGIAMLMVVLQHTMGGLETRFFTPLGGGE